MTNDRDRDRDTVAQPVEKKPKRRRPRGSGAVFKVRRTWWIAYRNAAGQRTRESSHSELKGAAERLLTKRNGAVEHNLPVVRNAERVTFTEAAQAMVDDYRQNGRPTNKLEGRIARHLTPTFGGMRLAAITSAMVAAYITHRLKEGIVNRKGVRVRDVSPAEINRELQCLKRIFSLAMEQDRIAMRPKIKLLKESAARSGFFEREQIDAVVRHLPTEIQPVVRFAYLSGWRVADEVLPLEWRNVDLAAGEVRIDAGASKNGEPRVIVMSTELRQVLTAQWTEHERLQKAGHLFPQVFFREVAKGRGGTKSPKVITSFGKAWKIACRLAGCPGKIPHDLRRTAVRNYVRAGIPQSVAMQMTGHKTASVFARYNITSGADLKAAAAKMDAAAGR